MRNDIVSKEFLEKIKNRLQFAVVLAFFFPVFLEAFFKLVARDASGTLINWGAVIVFLILSYLFLEIWGHRVYRGLAHIMNALLLGQIFFYALFILYVIIVHRHTLTFFGRAMAEISFYGILYLPVLILIACGINLVHLLMERRGKK